MFKFIKLKNAIILVITFYVIGIGYILIQNNISKRQAKASPINREELLNYIESEKNKGVNLVSIKNKFGLCRKIINLDLSELDLSNVDFTDILELGNINFTNSNLQNVKFGNNRFYGIDFSKANLIGATGLKGTDRYNSFSCYNCNFTDTNLQNLDLSYADLKYNDMLNANLKYTNLSFVDLKSTNLERADFSYSILDGSILDYAELSGVKFNGARVKNLNFTNVTLSEEQKHLLENQAAITDAKSLERAVKKQQDLSYFNFGNESNTRTYNNLDLSNGNFANSVAGSGPSYSNIVNSKIYVEFQGSNFTNANLKSVNLISANYSDADLSGANLKNSKIIYSKFNHTDFTNSDLTNALIGGDFSNANFKGAILNNTVFDCGSIFHNTSFGGAELKEVSIECMDHNEGIIGLSKDGLKEIKFIPIIKHSSWYYLPQIITRFFGEVMLILCIPFIIASGDAI